MCGIAGILKFNPNEEVEQWRLLAMRDSLFHRGPDEGGVMHDGRIGLAHRRLSIIDLATGQQPMTNPERTVWLTYNGEVYNYRELRTRLETLGARFQTRSDTEVVLRAYEYFGEECVEHMNGMFAFAIWDGPKQRLFLARDRLGIKPLYYAINDKQLIFGSEIKAILAEGSLQPAFNRDVLPEFLASRYVSGSETFFNGVRKLLPGHTLSWTADSGFRKHRYWNLSAKPHTGPELSRSEYVDLVRTTLKDAVQSHMVSDVPCGLFLSGGLDSSILAAMMTQISPEPVHSFSVGFSEEAANEFSYARLAAQSAGTRHHEVLVSPEEFFSALPHMVWHEDEPVAWTSSVPLHAVSALARKHVKVVLTGEGSDELFLGYDYRYRVTAWNNRLGKMYGKAVPQALREGLAGAIGKLPPRARRYAERTFLAVDTDPRHMFFENFSVFRHDLRQQLLNPEHEYTDNPYSGSLKLYHAAGDEPLQCMSHADLQTFLVELLMKQDQMSMAASVESRVPFLDHRLVETVSAIPAREKLRVWQTKALLRDAVKDLVPREILERKKMGFPVPTSGWLRGKYWPVVEEFVTSERALARGHFNRDVVRRLANEHHHGVADHGERLWLLINLEMWQRIFIEGEKAAAVYPRKTPVLSEFASELAQPALAMH
jgi:asparagine synthase (glutamine-hydrolysing)